MLQESVDSPFSFFELGNRRPGDLSGEPLLPVGRDLFEEAIPGFLVFAEAFL
jgi:hypothetical protein